MESLSYSCPLRCSRDDHLVVDWLLSSPEHNRGAMQLSVHREGSPEVPASSSERGPVGRPKAAETALAVVQR